MLNKISVMRIIILVHLLVTKQYHAGKAPTLTSLIKFEECQTENLGHVFLVGKDVSLRKCAAHCSKKDWCKGLAFVKNLMLCSLYNNMTSWEKMQSTRGDCAVIYKANLTGINFADVELEKLNECDEFVSVANGIVLGNMNREGNRKQVVCNEWFKIESGGSDISQCRNGTWAPKPKCVQACKDGWTLFGNSCYYLAENKMTADEAKNACKSVGGTLLTWTTDHDKEFLDSIRGDGLWTGWTAWTVWRTESNQIQNMYTNEIISWDQCHHGRQTPSDDHKCIAVHIQFGLTKPCLHFETCSNQWKTACKHDLVHTN
ncbi:uncharacterized protein LOC127856298 [Dreissena polymorpha]|uniref:Uncharacterized protein n=1 Tax=Dreissena polymorpha TaxID=45954 RepID=A0A9D4C9B9_DREPO|nr:uncharacterized protein LOC127856298 [Dreissena polymorpha]KAH3719907.1 hypothetical protein DPMN_062791 [Dreissena polymorpha]